MDLRQRAKQLKKDIPAVFLCLKSPRTPWYAKVLAALTVVYALSPVDLVPDFIPVLGYLDDVILLPGLVALTLRCLPPEELARCRVEAEGMWADGKPEKWYYALPIAAVWILVLVLILKCIFNVLTF